MGERNLFRKKKKENVIFEQGRIPPQATDLEEVVLGAAMLEKKRAREFAKISDPEYFYKEAHKLIAKAIIHIYTEHGVHPDILLVANQLKKEEQLELAGGSYYLEQLTLRIASTYNFEFWCRIIQEQWMKRNAIKIGYEIINTGFSDDSDPFDVISNGIDDLQKTFPDEGGDTISSALDKSIDEILLFSRGEAKTIYETGLVNLDSKLALTSSLVLIAGASGVGKTTFTTFLMKRLLERNEDVSILWYVIDHESGASIFHKFYSIDLLLELSELKSVENKISQRDLDLIMGLKNSYSNYDIEFKDQPCFIRDIKNEFRIFCSKRQNSLNVLIVDNLMRLKDNLERGNQVQKDDYIANMLADIYKENKKNNPLVIALHHFSDEQQDIGNLQDAYRPREKHIKGSGRFRDVMEKIILINWPGNYYDVVKQYPGHEKILQYLFIAEITKNTFGKKGFTYFFADHKYARFKEINEINKFL